MITDKINTHLNDGHRIIIGYCTPNGALHYSVIYGKYKMEDVMYYKVADPWGGAAVEWSEYGLCNRLKWVNGYDESTFNGMVKGIQWLE